MTFCSIVSRVFWNAASGFRYFYRQGFNCLLGECFAFFDCEVYNGSASHRCYLLSALLKRNPVYTIYAEPL